MVDFEFFREIIFPRLLDGTLMTILLIVLSLLPQVLIGILAAIGRVYGNKIISRLSLAYVVFFRGTPLLIQLFILYYGLPSIGIYLSPVFAAVTGFSLCGGAFQSEYVRGAIQSIKKGQMQAALSLGLTRTGAILFVILPQAMRRALPGLANEITYLVKYSSLAFMITVIELTGAGKIIAGRYFIYTYIFTLIAVIYLVLVTIVTRIQKRLEARLSYPGIVTGR